MLVQANTGGQLRGFSLVIRLLLQSNVKTNREGTQTAADWKKNFKNKKTERKKEKKSVENVATSSGSEFGFSGYTPLS